MQTVTFKAPPKLISKLSRMAADRDRSLSYLLRQAVEEYIADSKEDEKDTQIAIERLKNYQGDGISLEELDKKYGLGRPARKKR